MWLARFARALARWRANGNNSKSSAVSSPARFSFSSLGIESLIPTPSSAVSHIKTPKLAGILEWWNNGTLAYRKKKATTPVFQYSITPFFHTSFFYRQFFFTQSTISIRLANQTSENDFA